MQRSKTTNGHLHESPGSPWTCPDADGRYAPFAPEKYNTYGPLTPLSSKEVQELVIYLQTLGPENRQTAFISIAPFARIWLTEGILDTLEAHNLTFPPECLHELELPMEPWRMYAIDKPRYDSFGSQQFSAFGALCHPSNLTYLFTHTFDLPKDSLLADSNTHLTSLARNLLGAWGRIKSRSLTMKRGSKSTDPKTDLLNLVLQDPSLRHSLCQGLLIHSKKENFLLGTSTYLSDKFPATFWAPWSAAILAHMKRDPKALGSHQFTLSGELIATLYTCVKGAEQIPSDKHEKKMPVATGSNTQHSIETLDYFDLVSKQVGTDHWTPSIWQRVPESYRTIPNAKALATNQLNNVPLLSHFISSKILDQHLTGSILNWTQSHHKLPASILETWQRANILHSALSSGYPSTVELLLKHVPLTQWIEPDSIRKADNSNTPLEEALIEHATQIERMEKRYSKNTELALNPFEIDLTPADDTPDAQTFTTFIAYQIEKERANFTACCMHLFAAHWRPATTHIIWKSTLFTQALSQFEHIQLVKTLQSHPTNPLSQTTSNSLADPEQSKTVAKDKRMRI